MYRCKCETGSVVVMQVDRIPQKALPASAEVRPVDASGLGANILVWLVVQRFIAVVAPAPKMLNVLLAQIPPQTVFHPLQ